MLIANYDMEERKKSLPMQMNLFELFDEQKGALWKGMERKEKEDVTDCRSGRANE